MSADEIDDVAYRLKALSREWHRAGLVGQDRHGAEFAIRYRVLAEQAVAEVERHRLRDRLVEAARAPMDDE